jgi:16S rRNA processing protein RimM
VGAARRVALGHVSGVFGVLGWIKLTSYTRPADAILEYPKWVIGERSWKVMEGRLHGTSVVARLKGLDDRDEAAALQGSTIEVEREAMPKPELGQYYWADLVGCQVESESGKPLGRVESLFSNGAQDVLVVKGDRERLIPFVAGPIVKTIDLETQKIVVDWEPEY